MNLDNLAYELKRRQFAMKVHEQLVEEAFEKSLGTPEAMSPKDMKSAIMSLRSIIQSHEDLIETLYAHLTEAKKPWYKRIFKK